jgi:hypothetical protein
MNRVPHIFKIRLSKETILSEGHGVRFNAEETKYSLVASYISKSLLDRSCIFKTEILENGAKTLASVFDGSTTIDQGTQKILVDTYPNLVSTLEDMNYGISTLTV